MTWTARLRGSPLDPARFVLPLAAGLRLLGLTSRPIWYDEAFAILFSRAGPAAMTYGTLAPDALGSASDIHPLGYYTLLWGWMKLFGESIPAVRLLSVLFGLATVWLGMRLLSDLAGPTAGAWGGLFLAAGAFPVHYSQEIRMYALLACLLLAAVYFHWRGSGWLPHTGPGRPRDWIFFTLLAAGAQYTHNLAAFFLVPLALLPLIRRDWRSFRLTAVSGLAAALLYAPWLVQLPGQIARVGTAYWTAPPGAARIVTTLLTFVSNLPVPDPVLPLALLAAVLTLVLAAWQTLRTFRTNRAAALPGLLLAWLAFVPPALMFAVSQWMPVYIERALLPSGVFFLLWAAWALAATPVPVPVRAAALGVLFLGMLAGSYSHLTYTGFPYGRFGEINAAFRAGGTEQAVIVHANKLSALPAYLDDPGLPQHYLADPPGSGSDTLARPTQEVIGYLASASIEEAAGEVSRVWFVVFRRQMEEQAALDAGPLPELPWLEAHYRLDQVSAWGDLQVFEYSRP